MDNEIKAKRISYIICGFICIIGGFFFFYELGGGLFKITDLINQQGMVIIILPMSFILIGLYSITKGLSHSDDKFANAIAKDQILTNIIIIFISLLFPIFKLINDGKDETTISDFALSIILTIGLIAFIKYILPIIIKIYNKFKGNNI